MAGWHKMMRSGHHTPSLTLELTVKPWQKRFLLEISALRQYSTLMYIPRCQGSEYSKGTSGQALYSMNRHPSSHECWLHRMML